MKIHHQPTLFTQRLILRNFTEQDLGCLFTLLHDEEVNVFLPWFPVKDIAEAQQFLNKRFLGDRKSTRLNSSHH